MADGRRQKCMSVLISTASGHCRRRGLVGGEEERQEAPDRGQETRRELLNQVQEGRPPPYALHGKKVLLMVIYMFH